MKKEELKRLLPEMEKLAEENERLLKLMKENEALCKHMYEENKSQASKVFYEYFAKGVKEMEQHVSWIRNAVDEYKRI